MTDIKASIILVNYNTRRLLSGCLTSISKRLVGVAYEVLVVDNASTDGSVAMVRTDFPEVTVIANSVNVGFGRANNQAALLAKGKYLFFLNSDTELKNNVLAELLSAAECYPRSILGCRLVDGSGVTLHYASAFATPLRSAFRLLLLSFPRLKVLLRLMPRTGSAKDPDRFETVDYVCGADLFVEASVFSLIGGFHEGYFMFYEDDDFCRRAARHGLTCVIAHNAEVIHFESRSPMMSAFKLKVFEKSYRVYFQRFYPSTALLSRALVAGIAIARLLFASQYKFLDRVRLLKDAVNAD